MWTTECQGYKKEKIFFKLCFISVKCFGFNAGLLSTAIDPFFS